MTKLTTTSAIAALPIEATDLARPAAQRAPTCACWPPPAHAGPHLILLSALRDRCAQYNVDTSSTVYYVAAQARADQDITHLHYAMRDLGRAYDWIAALQFLADRHQLCNEACTDAPLDAD